MQWASGSVFCPAPSLPGAAGIADPVQCWPAGSGTWPSGLLSAQARKPCSADYELDDYEVRTVTVGDVRIMANSVNGQFCVRPLVGFPKSMPCSGS